MDTNIKTDWCVYLLFSIEHNRTYIGASNNVHRRLRQHNGEIVGGAKYTRSYRPWKHILIVNGFTKTQALCFEWRIKRIKASNSNKLIINHGPLLKKINNIFNVLNLEYYTKKCKASSNNLNIEWIDDTLYIEDRILPNNISQTLINNNNDTNKNNTIININKDINNNETNLN